MDTGGCGLCKPGSDPRTSPRPFPASPLRVAWVNLQSLPKRVVGLRLFCSLPDGKCALENTEIEESVTFNSNCAPADSLSVTMENQILLDITSLIDSGLVTEILSQNSSVPAKNFQLGAAGVGNPAEDGLLSSQDAADVGETLLDHKYSLTSENQKAVVKVHAVHLHGNNNRDDEDLEKYEELHLPEEAEHAHSPYLPSDGVPFLSSVAMQRKNCSVPTSSVFAPEGTVNQNVGTIPVRLSEVGIFTDSCLFVP